MNYAEETRALKILFLSVFPPYRGGISRFSKYLQNYISEYTTTEAITYSRLYPDVLFPGKSQFDPDTDSQPATALVHTYNPATWKSSAEALHQRGPEIFLFSHWHPFIIPSTLSLIKHLKSKNPGIITAGIYHNVQPHEYFPLRKNLIRRLIQNTDIPVLLSSQTEKEFRALTPGADSHRLFHPVYTRPVPETPSGDIRRRYGIEKEDYLILFFGLIRHYKGLDLFLRALQHIDLKQRNIRVLVAGEFYIKPGPIYELVRDEDRDRILFADRYIPDREADELLKASDTMVLPYRSASQSGILADAINFDLPVICSDQPGFTDIVTHNVHGKIVPGGNIEALHQAIIAMTDRDRLREYRENIKSLREELGWNTFARRLYDKFRYYTDY